MGVVQSQRMGTAMSTWPGMRAKWVIRKVRKGGECGLPGPATQESSLRRKPWPGLNPPGVVFGPQRLHHMSFAEAFDRFSRLHARGVEVERVVLDTMPPIRRSEPGNPYADAQGYVYYPDINPVQELADLMSAARAYQLNVAAIQTTKSMIQESFQILLS